jgi:hypothetical protein
VEHTVEQLAREGNGAVEVDEPTHTPLKIVLAGPIRVWWSEWGSERHATYTLWRDAARVTLVHAGFLVYNPHRAWQGAWHEDAQQVNDAAIAIADVVVVLTPPEVPADGTEAEMRVAAEHGVPVVLAPPGGEADLVAMLASIHSCTKPVL